ncbi:MAG: hypothetical protein ABSH47_25235 [Bryobacteraceae bacterium]|jgi:nucleoside 2-deoxyribosyltransferase
MEFFIASPWRNKDAVKELSDSLAARGHIAYSFLDNGANLCTGAAVCDESKEFSKTLASRMDDPRIVRIFDAELERLRECDAVILLEPTGRSSLTEAGIAYGMGKPVILVGPIENPELVYRMCECRYPSGAAFLDAVPV